MPWMLFGLSKDAWDVLLGIGQLLVVLIGGIAAYRRFYVEGTDQARVEFSIKCRFLGPQQGNYLAAFTILARNRGNVAHRFEAISLRALGIKADQPLHTREERAPMAEFPETLFQDDNLVHPGGGCFFVRPDVKHELAYTTLIPHDVRFILVRASFTCRDTKEVYTAEKVFEVKSGGGSSSASQDDS